MKKFIIVLLAVATLGLSSCEKWLDVNKNPNDATTTTPYLLLPGMLTSWSSDVTSLTTLSGAWMGYWTHAGGWSGWYSEKKYEITANYLNLYGYYTGTLADNFYIRANSTNNRIYPAITDVVDSWYYARLVDCYGDVPYSEACQPTLTLTPKYDDAQTIYRDLITRLDSAMSVFTSWSKAADKTIPGTTYYFKSNTHDIIFSGDFLKWRSLANSLKLRLVMRLTNVLSVADLRAMVAKTQAYGYITADATGSPGYSASSGKTNPWWNSFGKSYDGVIVNATTQYVLNSYFHQKLSNLTDPRLNQYFWAPSSAPGGALKSIPYGTDGDLTVQPNSTVAANYSFVHIANDWTSKVTGNGALDRSKIMTYAEVLFLQAEAAQRGIYQVSGLAVDPAPIYTNAVTASLNAAKVAASAQTTYLAQANVAWNAAETDAMKIARIINQKYIANYFVNMFESYCDYRRTGYPNPKDPTLTVEMLSYYPGGVIKRQIPRIFPYPQADYDLNKINVQAAIDKQIQKNGVTFTTNSYPFNGRVFWDTAPAEIPYNY
ncbi:MAG: SusD/RagB family nutrient-binding outer membrane lipoprotein [Bacteroidales bacterium]